MSAMADYSFGYCTNVHAGASLEQARTNLRKYSASVRQRLAPQGKLPIGLWLSHRAAEALLRQDEVQQFKDWLAQQGLKPYTFNGFPQGDFHQPVVKHQVYEPTWLSEQRVQYTLMLADILATLLPEGQTGSISTLPLAWPHTPWQPEDYQQAATHLLTVAKTLERLHERTGREIVLAIEPEPGCVLDTCQDITGFFEQFLFCGDDERVARQYLSVCHDICHSGVMFEPQASVLDAYRSTGIRVGKVQVSSAVHVPWDTCTDAVDRASLLAQLRTFDEPKYLHQTTRCDASGGLLELAEDLSPALDQWLNGESIGSGPRYPWRIHFHVPIFVEQFNHLHTTQADITQAVQCLERHGQQPVEGRPWFTGHYEVETYAWPVLPAEVAIEDLAEGIAQELQFFSRLLRSQSLT